MKKRRPFRRVRGNDPWRKKTMDDVVDLLHLAEDRAAMPMAKMALVLLASKMAVVVVVVVETA